MLYLLSLSSNQDAKAVLQQAIGYLSQMGHIQLSQCYDFPADNPSAPNYKNMAMILKTQSKYQTIYQAIKHIEQRLGRQKKQLIVRLDIDILAYGENLQQCHWLVDITHAPIYVAQPVSDLIFERTFHLEIS